MVRNGVRETCVKHIMTTSRMLQPRFFGDRKKPPKKIGMAHRIANIFALNC
jgi:hypothetical protein